MLSEVTENVPHDNVQLSKTFFLREKRQRVQTSESASVSHGLLYIIAPVSVHQLNQVYTISVQAGMYKMLVLYMIPSQKTLSDPRQTDGQMHTRMHIHTQKTRTLMHYRSSVWHIRNFLFCYQYQISADLLALHVLIFKRL